MFSETRYGTPIAPLPPLAAIISRSQVPKKGDVKNHVFFCHRTSPPPPLFCIGWVGVGWQRHCITCRSLRELDNQSAVFCFFGGRPKLVVELDHLCEVKNLYSTQGN